VKRAALALVAAPLLLLAAGCASTNGGSSSPSASRPYWASSWASSSSFPGDNGACSARAKRLGGVSDPAPANRIDGPIQKWPNATAQETYDECMRDRGWRPAS
jgi:hypothetical protein